MGFTTGSAAAAGAKAGILALGGNDPGTKVDIPLPSGQRLKIPVHHLEQKGETVLTTIIKDGGDDPDATHQARIQVQVEIIDPHGQGICFQGGPGVGRVTKPGLPVPVGEPAINPVPRQQIVQAVKEALDATGLQGQVKVTISVPDGEKIALKTFNPRLGILGGISILGTRGTVKPFSHEAYKSTIIIGLKVAKATGLSYIAFSTGGRSERFLTELMPGLAENALIQVADFFAFSLKEARRHGFQKIYYSCFFGKLVKMALGFAYTHAHQNSLDFGQLAFWAQKSQLDPKLCSAISQANTARQVLEMIKGQAQALEFISLLCTKALDTAHKFAGQQAEISLYLFDFDGSLLAKTQTSTQTPIK